MTFPPEYPGALPSYIFYDNNCKLREHLVAVQDTYLLNKVGLVVDVFHFSTKHKSTDLQCQLYCNPANYPELMVLERQNPKDSPWYFNSSAAEQVNSWLVGFDSILREMTPENYNFLLDEVIAIRNEFIVQELNRKGLRPHLVSDDVLREVVQ